MRDRELKNYHAIIAIDSDELYLQTKILENDCWELLFYSRNRLS